MSPYIQINSEWIKDLNITPGTIKYIEENISTKLMDLGLGEDFMNWTLKTRQVKEKLIGALAGVAQWIEHQPANQRVAGSIPSQGTRLA